MIRDKESYKISSKANHKFFSFFVGISVFSIDQEKLRMEAGLKKTLAR